MKRVIVAGIVIAGLAGCATTQPVPQGRVAMVDTGERAHLQAKLNMTDLMALAEKLTNDMLMSDEVARWSEQGKKPRIVVGRIRNRTDLDNIPEEALYDRVVQTIVNSGVARVVDKSSTRFDYVLSGDIQSTTEYGQDGSKLRQFRVTLKMSNIDGELVGSWQGRMSLAKGAKPLF